MLRTFGLPKLMALNLGEEVQLLVKSAAERELNSLCFGSFRAGEREMGWEHGGRSSHNNKTEMPRDWNRI